MDSTFNMSPVRIAISMDRVGLFRKAAPLPWQRYTEVYEMPIQVRAQVTEAVTRANIYFERVADKVVSSSIRLWHQSMEPEMRRWLTTRLPQSGGIGFLLRGVIIQ